MTRASRSAPPAQPPGNLTRRLGAWVVLFGAFAVACGVSVPPPGGPEDKTPPAVVASVPAHDSAGVDPGSDIRIEFSENMTRERLERYVQFSPPIEYDDIDWDGRAIVIRPLGGLHPDTTYVVEIEKGFRDKHRVAAEKTFRFAFATSAAIDTGGVSGRVFFRREASAKGVVHAFMLPVDSGFAAGVTRPDRKATTTEEGYYRLRYLPLDDRAVLVWGFHDQNSNGAFDPDTEVGLEVPDTVRIAPGAPVVPNINLDIVDPKEPGVVQGRILDALGIDSLLISVGLYARGDSLPPDHLTVCDSVGWYEFPSVLRGSYELRAFVDFAPDSLCGSYPCGPDSSRVCVEPCVVHPDSVVVEPGQRVEMSPVTLEGAVE